MRKERVTEDIFIFQSEMYAQVTAGAIVTDEGTIVIDTLPFPRETREMIEFLRGESRDKRGIRYVINTHYHADHVYGNYLFAEADIISSEKCREILRKSGEKNLNEAKQSTPELADVVLRLPNLTFPDKMTFQLGERILKLVPLPGHTMDGIGIYIEGEKILFAGDAVMALPHIYWGDRDVLIATLNQIKEMNVENIVQGHGDVLLKGEIDESIDAQVAYLNCIYDRVKAKVATRTSKEKLADITLESCGGTPILLDGVVRKLHKDNVQRIYQTLTAKPRTDEKKNKVKA